MDDRTFLMKWIVANGVSEMLGLGTTFVVGTGVVPSLVDDASVGGLVVMALAAVLAGTLLEGVVVGFAQGRVLHRRRPAMGVGAWVAASCFGAAVAWFVGMAPSTVVALSSVGSAAPPPPEPGPLAQLALAAALGLVAGPILGLFQWRVLKRHVQNSGAWLWANALAWTVGMPVIFAGMDLVPWQGNALARTLAIYGVCLLTGMVVGAVHGPVLMHLTRTSPEGRSR